MRSGYTSFEAALKRVFLVLDEPLPVGTDWHAALLKRANRPIEGSRPEILDNELFVIADDLRRFRHVAMHVYDRFDAVGAAGAAEAAKRFLALIDPALSRFRLILDPD